MSYSDIYEPEKCVRPGCNHRKIKHTMIANTERMPDGSIPKFIFGKCKQKTCTCWRFI